ncbi:MAG: hypothetical protein EOO75_10970 [Myxococcales bacterium]|nr:MAG: hypothetical protein EOO75_10970 [Myxococcales bacterium]
MSVVVPVVEPATGQVELTIVQAPPSTEVFLGSTRLGAAPGPLRIRQGTAPLRLTLRAPGHVPRTIEFVPVASGSVEAGLTRQAGKGPTRAPGHPGDLETPY